SGSQYAAIACAIVPAPAQTRASGQELYQRSPKYWFVTSTNQSPSSDSVTPVPPLSARPAVATVTNPNPSTAPPHPPPSPARPPETGVPGSTRPRPPVPRPPLPPFTAPPPLRIARPRVSRPTQGNLRTPRLLETPRSVNGGRAAVNGPPETRKAPRREAGGPS